MDGRGRFVRSLSETLGLRPAPSPALAFARPPGGPVRVLLRGERAARGSTRWRLGLDRPAPRGLGVALAIGLLLGAAALGLAWGRQYQTFVDREGGIGDFVARALGLAVKVVSISGEAQLTEPEILALAGVSPKDSLPFFDAARTRRNLEALPLIKQASVRKLYPDRIIIDIVERTPVALWQKDGEVHAIAADGAVIGDLRDSRFSSLPFVVGEGANARLSEFMTLLDASAELRPKIVAGVLVGARRWNLKMKSGIDVKLPENDPLAAMATLLALQRQSRVLDRDILSLDLRVEGKVFARLSEEAAAARLEARSQKAAPL
ncbi:MAG: cell division protein FtsQ/DivIB [Roseiarcus sp.]|jgi:cell division protein FtsQ